MQFIEANGARIPAVGLGTWELRGRSCARLVEQALKFGYRHIDTAHSSGRGAPMCQSPTARMPHAIGLNRTASQPPPTIEPRVS